jgi:hypothetical protein
MVWIGLIWLRRGISRLRTDLFWDMRPCHLNK